MNTLVIAQVKISPPPIVVFNWGRPGGGRMLLDKERVARVPGRPPGIIKIESTEKSIDRLIYELYGLTEEEVKIVEGD